MSPREGAREVERGTVIEDKPRTPMQWGSSHKTRGELAPKEGVLWIKTRVKGQRTTAVSDL